MTSSARIVIETSGDLGLAFIRDVMLASEPPFPKDDKDVGWIAPPIPGSGGYDMSHRPSFISYGTEEQNVEEEGKYKNGRTWATRTTWHPIFAEKKEKDVYLLHFVNRTLYWNEKRELVVCLYILRSAFIGSNELAYRVCSDCGAANSAVGYLNEDWQQEHTMCGACQRDIGGFSYEDI